MRPQGRSGASSVLYSTYGALESMSSTMAKGVNGLNYSWKRLMSMQKLGSAQEDLNMQLMKEVEAEDIAFQSVKPQKSSKSGYFGGLLNNLNDPSKRPKRDYRLPKPGRSKANLTLEETADEFPEIPSLSQALLCRGLSASSGPLRKRGKQLLSPCSRLKPILTWDLKSTANEEKLSITLGRIAFNSRFVGKEKQKKRAKLPLTTISTGVGTCDQTDYTVELRKERARDVSGSVGATPKARKQGRSQVSQWLEHMLKEQPHVRRQGRERTGLYSRGPKRISTLPSHSFTALLSDEISSSVHIFRSGKSLLS